MDFKDLDKLITDNASDLLYVIREVAKRGTSEKTADSDDFETLLLRREFKDLVVGELYEGYFLPERHESDWQLLHELVTIMSSPHVREFLASSVAGILGNAAYSTLSALLRRIVSEMRKRKLPKAKQLPYLEMKDDLDKIQSFFERNKCAQILEIESSTGVPRERVYPLLKLLGFKHYHQRSHLWCAPGTENQSHPRVKQQASRRPRR